MNSTRVSFSVSLPTKLCSILIHLSSVPLFITVPTSSICKDKLHLAMLSILSKPFTRGRLSSVAPVNEESPNANSDQCQADGYHSVDPE